MFGYSFSKPSYKCVLRLTLHSGAWRWRAIILLILPALVLGGCITFPSAETASADYAVYTAPPDDGQMAISFEYPSGWCLTCRDGSDHYVYFRLYEPLSGVCEADLQGVYTVSGYPMWGQVIDFETEHIGINHSDLADWISSEQDAFRELSENWQALYGVSDYGVYTQTIVIDGRPATRVGVCYTPGAGGYPPPPTVMTAVYFQVGQWLYRVSTLDEVERPCDPHVENPVFDHILQTLTILPPPE